MANGMAGKRTESLVPNMTSWRLARNCLSITYRTLETSVRSDFFRNDEDDMLCAVLPWRISLLDPFNPFSNAHGSCREAILFCHNLSRFSNHKTLLSIVIIYLDEFVFKPQSVINRTLHAASRKFHRNNIKRIKWLHTNLSFYHLWFSSFKRLYILVKVKMQFQFIYFN